MKKTKIRLFIRTSPADIDRPQPRYWQLIDNRLCWRLAPISPSLYTIIIKYE